jgi:hypothetical protein
MTPIITSQFPLPVKSYFSAHSHTLFMDVWTQPLRLKGRSLEVAHCFAKQCSSIYCWGERGGGEKISPNFPQLTFTMHWKCSCMARPTIPITVKYRPSDFLLLSLLREFSPGFLLLCCRVGGTVSCLSWITNHPASSESPQHLISYGIGRYRMGENFLEELNFSYSVCVV